MTKNRDLPPLCGVTGAAKILQVTRQNMPHTMKAKGAPKPATYIDGHPVWFVRDIEDYAKVREERRKNYRRGEENFL